MHNYDTDPKIILQNSQFGEMRISEKAIIHFKKGLLGYEFLKRFALLDIKECQPFLWLIPVEEPEINFPILNFELVSPKYKLNLTAPDKVSLALDDAETFMLFFIVTVDEERGLVTANLKGPLVINPEKNTGIQVVVPNEEYAVNYPITHKEKSC